MTPLAPSAIAAHALAAAALPMTILRAPLDIVVARALRRHPEIARRLRWEHERALRIEVSDLPLSFLLSCGSGRIRIAVRGRRPASAADAVIRAPIATLLDLVRGEVDGDALFFSRELSIEGDTEVVVSLRNAVDGAGIDPVADLAPLPAPLVPMARMALADFRRLLRAMARDLAWLQALVERLTPTEGSRAE